MNIPTVRDIAVSAEQIRRGDVVRVGGLPHQVIDIRRLPNSGKRRLQFDDGNAYVLPEQSSITVSRAFANSRRQPYYKPPPRSGETSLPAPERKDPKPAKD